MELFVSSQIFKSFQYLLMSFTYSSSTEERPGLQKLFKKQSNSLWNNAVHLIQFISQRGGILNFSEPTSNKEDDLIRVNFGELEDLAHALDMEKTLERQAIYIHRELAKCQRGSFNSEMEHIILFIGIICGVIEGICIPAIIVVYGKMTQIFITQYINMAYLNFRETQIDLLGFHWLQDTSRINTSVVHVVQDVRYLAIEMIILAIIQLFCGSVFVIAINTSSETIAKKNRLRYLKSLLYNELEWFDKQDSKEIVQNTITLMQNFHSSSIIRLGILIHLLSVIGSSIAIALFYGWELALVCLIALPVVILVKFAFTMIGKCLCLFNTNIYFKSEDLVEDVLKNWKSVVAYQGEILEKKLYEKSLLYCHKAWLKIGTFYGMLNGLLWLIMYSSYALTLFYGRLIIIERKDYSYTPEVLVVVFFCVQVVIATSLHIPMFVKSLYKAFRAGKEMQSVTISPGLAKQKDLSLNMIEFRNVTFSYPSNPHMKVLNNISLTISRGEMVVLVGCPKSGRSTFLKLIHRLYDVQSGVIYLNKTNIRHVNSLQLRDKIGFVQQNTFLFGPTISDAICCGRIDVMPLDVMQAAVSVDAHNLIVAMPKQYQTPLSHFLSQEKLKQRLAVARALVFKPQLVMLDNATSSLTDEEEIKLHQSIIRSEPYRILIIVSPRISTMKMATNILYLVKGVVIEKGSYEELMGKKGKFFNMIEHVTTVYGHDKNTDFIDDFQPSIHLQPHNNHQKSSTQKKWADQNKDEPHFSNGTVYLSRLPTWGHQLDDPTLNYFERPTKILPWTKILRMNSKEWPYLLTGCIAATINGVSLIAYGILFGECIIVSVLWEYREVYNRFALFINIFLIAGVISGIGVMVQGYAVSVASSKLVQRLRTKAFSAILRQNFEWFSAPENNLESLLELLRTDTVNVHMAAGPRLVSATQTTCIVLGCVFLAISYNYILGLVVIIFMPFILLGSIILRRLLGEDKISEGIELNMIKIMLGEVVNEIEVVIGLNVQEMVLNKHVSTFEQCYKKQRTSVKVRGLLYGLLRSLPTLGCVVCMLVGTYLMENKMVPLESIFQVSESMFVGSVIAGQVIFLIPSVTKARISATKIFNLIGQKSQVSLYDHKDGKLMQSLDACKGPFSSRSKNLGLDIWNKNTTIEFKEVDFESENPSIPSLNNFQLKIKKGHTAGLVDLSGSWNSLPILLLLRMCNPKSGSVVIGEREINLINLETLLRHIGWADGNPTFFRRSVFENIAYGDNTRDIRINEIVTVAEIANIHNYIITLPDGYSTIIDETIKMTYGQRIRLSLARALIRDPEILLLDNLQVLEDEDGEVLAEAAIRNASLGRTCLFVSQYLKSALRNADVIYLMQDGTIKEKGTHHGLIGNKKVYYELYHKQNIQRQ